MYIQKYYAITVKIRNEPIFGDFHSQLFFIILFSWGRAQNRYEDTNFSVLSVLFRW